MNRSPFIVYSLPRSRSAWVARFLSYNGRTCGHDLATRCGDSVAKLAAMIRQFGGTAETGAIAGWRAIRIEMPEAKIAVIRRPVAEVYESLARFGLGSDLLMKELCDRDAMLDQLARVSGVRSFQFSDLNGIDACRDLFEHCLGDLFDWEWWESLASVNIQVDVKAELQRVMDNHNQIEALKADALRIGSDGVNIGPEPWDSVWPEIDDLFAEHFGEVEGDLAEQRPYRLDEPAMRAMAAAGTLRIFTARVDGILAGYCMWSVTKDVESAGMLIAQHGPWFVKKQFGHLMLGPKLFDASLDDLRAIGVKTAFPHHRLQGRGAKLGAFFKRRGAVETQRTYMMALGEPQHA